ncbi:MAG: hypothetical protein V1913_07305, partial [Fibrobacterota bacterium]
MNSHPKTVPAFFLFLLFSLVSQSGAQLTYARHVLNDTLKADTIFFQGSDTGITTAKVILKAEAGEGGRGGLDIMMVMDFSFSIKDYSADNTDRKIFLMDNALQKFIGNLDSLADSTRALTGHLQRNDNIAIMRYGGMEAYSFGYTPQVTVPQCGYHIIPTGFDTAHSIRVYPQDTLAFVPGSMVGAIDTFMGRDIYNNPWDKLRLDNGASWGLKRLLWDYWHFNYGLTPVVNGSRPQGYEYDSSYFYTVTNMMTWGYWHSAGTTADPRIGDTQTATYYALWKSIDYCMKYRTNSGSQPVIILLTDGTDNRSNDQ